MAGCPVPRLQQDEGDVMGEIVYAPYEQLTPEQREWWWTDLIREAAAAETMWSGDDPPDPLAVVRRVEDRLEET